MVVCRWWRRKKADTLMTHYSGQQQKDGSYHQMTTMIVLHTHKFKLTSHMLLDNSTCYTILTPSSKYNYWHPNILSAPQQLAPLNLMANMWESLNCAGVACMLCGSAAWHCLWLCCLRVVVYWRPWFLYHFVPWCWLSQGSVVIIHWHCASLTLCFLHPNPQTMFAPWTQIT